MIASRADWPVDRWLQGLRDDQALRSREGPSEIDRKILSCAEAVRARTVWLEYRDRRSRHDRAVRSRRAWPATRSLSRLPFFVFLAIAVVCAACGQTGPLTLERPVDAAPAPAAESAVVEPDEPAEPDDRETDGGAGDDPGDAGAR